MAQVFVSHCKEDMSIALDLALGLEEAGYSTWCYEIDSVVGPNYHRQINQTVHQCGAILLVISPTSLKSGEVTNEVTEAHSCQRPFLPILHGMTYDEFNTEARNWPAEIKAAGPIRIPSEGAQEILSRITRGLRTLNVLPHAKPNHERIAEVRSYIQKYHDAPFESRQPPGVQSIVRLQRASKRLSPTSRAGVVGLLVGVVALAAAKSVGSWISLVPPAALKPKMSTVRHERVAIMDFQNRARNPDPSNDWMREGLRDDIVTDLNAIPALEVFAGPEVRILADGDLDPITSARKAEMTKVIVGSFTVEHETIKIWLSAKDVATASTIAAISHEGPFAELDRVREVAIKKLLLRLQLRLPGEEKRNFRPRQRDNLEAKKLLVYAERPGSPVLPTPSPRSDDISLLPRILHPLLAPAYAAEDETTDSRKELAAILENYRIAFEHQDIDELKNYYADFNEDQARALRAYFENAEDLRIQFDDQRISVLGEKAAISYTRTDNFVDRHSGEAQTVVIRHTKVFAKGRNGWQIIQLPGAQSSN